MKHFRLILACAIATFCLGMYLNAQAPTSFTVLPGAQGITGATGSTGPTGATGPTGLSVAGVNASITASSLGTQAICALHTDSGCLNSVTDATAANCPAGTLTAACTFPTSITVPANTLGSTVTLLSLPMGALGTATIPTALIEIYLDSVRVFAGSALAPGAGSHVNIFSCAFSAAASGVAAPLAASCHGNGSFAASNSANTLLTNTAPAIAIDTTVSHVLKVSMAFSANTTGNSAWLYGLRFSQ